MNIKSFVECAVAGGWEPREVALYQRFPNPMRKNGYIDREFYGIFLDPLAWKAVGTVAGWAHEVAMLTGGYYENKPMHCRTFEEHVDLYKDRKAAEDNWRCARVVPYWHYLFVKMNDELAEGRTLEEYLETL